jgi:AcrR family transcriptional regulator
MQKKTKKERMLEAAFNLFLKHGFANTKIIDIADEAGVGKGTVYEYFPSKEVLFAEVFKSRIIEDYKRVGVILSSSCSAEEKLLNYARFEAENLQNFGDSLHLLPDMVMSSCSGCSDEFHRSLYDLWAMRFSAVKEIIQEGIGNGEFSQGDSEMTAMSVLGSLNFYLLSKYNMMPVACPAIVDASSWNLESYAKIILQGIKGSFRGVEVHNVYSFFLSNILNFEKIYIFLYCF